MDATIDQADKKTASRDRWVRRLAVGLVAAVYVAAVLASGSAGSRWVAETLIDQAEARLPLAVAALTGEIEKQRAVPIVLAEDPLIREVLGDPRVETLRQADTKLNRLASATHAAVIYLLDRSGTAVSASNAGRPDSFVGSSYRFRPYYLEALRDGAAEQVALGTVSRRPGVYLSARVAAPDGAALGVVVVKLELDAVESDWRRGGQPVLVLDEHGIVVATSVPDWRFRTTRPLDAATAAAIRESLQFGAARLDPLPVLADPDIAGLALADAGSGRQRFAVAETAVEGALPGWRLRLFVPATNALLAAGSLAQIVAALLFALLLLAAFLAWKRSRRRERQRLLDAHAAALLEAKVAARTVDLGAANERLRREMAERERAEARMVALREDLAQANRLATLGQVTAGVAHEINQPLAAIRTYAENAARFLQRDDTASASDNLGIVVKLTERIAVITETLRGFARRGPNVLEPLLVADIVDGALLILRSRLREADVVLERRQERPDIAIMGGRIRLEQVLVNLLRNALEALQGRTDGRIGLTVAQAGGEVRIEVADNGPGVPDDILPALFTPFKTSKPKGLGLGLVISSDIVTELGGRLEVESRPGDGARFIIRLPKVEAP